MDIEQIKRQAREELKQEQFRTAVDEYKKKLTAAKWWHRLLPWRVIIIRRENV